MEIDPNVYITDEQKREIVADAFQEQARRMARADFERILSNAGYHIVHSEVDKAFDGDMAATIKEKAVEVIGGISASTVFRAPTAWDKEPSIAYAYLQDAMREAKPAITDRVHEIIASLDEARLRELIEGSVVDAILSKLTARSIP